MALPQEDYEPKAEFLIADLNVLIAERRSADSQLERKTASVINALQEREDFRGMASSAIDDAERIRAFKFDDDSRNDIRELLREVENKATIISAYNVWIDRAEYLRKQIQKTDPDKRLAIGAMGACAGDGAIAENPVTAAPNAQSG